MILGDIAEELNIGHLQFKAKHVEKRPLEILLKRYLS